jgi:hypothetical protein
VGALVARAGRRRAPAPVAPVAPAAPSQLRRYRGAAMGDGD